MAYVVSILNEPTLPHFAEAWLALPNLDMEGKMPGMVLSEGTTFGGDNNFGQVMIGAVHAKRDQLAASFL